MGELIFDFSSVKLPNIILCSALLASSDSCKPSDQANMQFGDFY